MEDKGSAYEMNPVRRYENRMKAPPARAVPKPFMRRVLSTRDAGEQFSIGILGVLCVAGAFL